MENCVSSPQHRVTTIHLPRHANNVSDHLPIRLQTSVLCNQSQSVEHTVNAQCPQVTHTWGNHGYTNAYRNALETKLNEIQKLSCNRETDQETSRDAIGAYIGGLGLYRDVWIAAIASSRTRLATLSGVMCNTSQCELRSLRVNSGRLNVIRIVTYYTLPPLESPDSFWIAMACLR